MPRVGGFQAFHAVIRLLPCLGTKMSARPTLSRSSVPWAILDKALDKAQIFGDSQKKSPTRNKIAAIQPPRLLTKSPQPLHSDLLKDGRRALLLSQKKFQPSTDA